MGSQEPKSDQTFSVMEPGVASGISSAAPSEVTPATCSSEKDALLLNSDDASKSRTGSIDPAKNNEDAQLASDYNKGGFPVGSMPTINELPIDASATESPPTQLMDRTGESPLPDPNRIPPHVFARTKSTAPVEWSVASNESLFSIHMGNMSFTNEQLSWMNKSGDFGFTGDGQFSGDIPYSPSPSPPPPPPLVNNKSPESSVKSGNLNQGLSATEAAAAETMREVIRENDSDHNNQEKSPPKAVSPQKTDPRALSAKRSDDSSIKSFAFPILTGEGNKSRSMSNNLEKKKKQHSQPSTPKTALEPETTAAMSEPLTPKEQAPKATTKNAGQGKWFSCFSCCPFCS